MLNYFSEMVELKVSKCSYMRCAKYCLLQALLQDLFEVLFKNPLEPGFETRLETCFDIPL